VSEGFDTTMFDQEVTDLMGFGLTSLQARVYAALLGEGAVKAGRLCSMVGIIRPEVYRVLRELSVKGLVQRDLGTPSRYTAVHPNQALSLLLNREIEKLGSLQKKKAALVDSLTSRGSRANQESEHFSVITGWGNFILTLVRMIESAKSDYAGIISRDGLKRARDVNVAPALIAAKKRGVRVRMISEIDETNMHVAKYLSRHIQLHRSKDLLFYIDIVDKTELVLGPSVTDIEATTQRIWRESDLWTNNQKFVNGMYAMFERFWLATRKFDHPPEHIKRI